MKYKIEVSDSAELALDTIPKKDRNRIAEKIDSLGENPRPDGYIKLKGTSKAAFYRIRSGNYRIVYTVKDDILLVLVVEIGHRKEIYR